MTSRLEPPSKLSLPASPWIRFVPPPALIESSPAPPSKRSFSPAPVIVSLPSPPSTRGLTASLPLASEIVIVSLPPPAETRIDLTAPTSNSSGIPLLMTTCTCGCLSVLRPTVIVSPPPLPVTRSRPLISSIAPESNRRDSRRSREIGIICVGTSSRSSSGQSADSSPRKPAAFARGCRRPRGLCRPRRLCSAPQLFLLRRKRQHVHRLCAPALAVAVLDRHVHELLGLVDRLDQRQPIRQSRRDRSAERATAAVGLVVRLGLGGELEVLPPVEEHVHDLVTGL